MTTLTYRGFVGTYERSPNGVTPCTATNGKHTLWFEGENEQDAKDDLTSVVNDYFHSKKLEGVV